MPREPVGGGRHSVLGPILTAGVAAIGLTTVALNDPAQGGLFLRCPMFALTGHWCPGCGMTRATHALLRGDPVAALGSNLMLPVFAALAVGGWMTWFRGLRGRPPPKWPAQAPLWSWIVLGAMMIAFTVARNLPISPFDELAP